MKTDAVLSLLGSLEGIADRYAMRVPSTGKGEADAYNAGRTAAALDMKDAIRKARKVVEDVGIEATSGMTLFELGATIRTMRELQELSRKAPQSQERRTAAARYELRCDTLIKKILADDAAQTIHLPFK